MILKNHFETAPFLKVALLRVFHLCFVFPLFFVSKWHIISSFHKLLKLSIRLSIRLSINQGK